MSEKPGPHAVFHIPERTPLDTRSRTVYYNAMTTRQEVAKQIRERRKALGMTREQLAHYVDVTYQTIANWEVGRRLPSHECRIRLAEVLGKGQWLSLE